MYIPTSFREDKKETLLAFMRAHSFATLVSIVGGVPFASHIPLAVEERDDTIFLTGHVSKANPHVEAFTETSAATLAIFTGPHAYVSPTAYEARESVPTWNYIAVHALGVPRAIQAASDPAAIEAMLEQMIMQYDPSYPAQWRQLTARYREGMMRGIVGFEMPVQTLEGKFKLSQNRPVHDQKSVASVLSESTDASARAVAALMQERQS